MSDFQGYWRIKAYGHTQTIANGERVYPRVKDTHATKCSKWETKHDTLLHDCRAHLVKHHNQTYDYEAAILDRGLESTLATLRRLHLKSSEPQLPGTEKLLFVVGKRGSGRGQFEWPRDIAVNPIDGDIFIADAMNHRVQVFNNHGIWKKTIDGGRGGAAAAAAGKGEGPDADAAASTQSRQTKTTAHKTWIDSRLAGSVPIVETPLSEQPPREQQMQLQLYVDAATESGGSPQAISPKLDDNNNVNDNNPEATLNRPMGVAISPVDGRLYVADSENCAIKIYSSSSSTARFKGAIYLSQKSKPISVDVDVAGNVVVLSSYPIKAIEIFSTTEHFGETLRRFKACRDHRTNECDCSPRFVAVPPSVPQKHEVFVTDVAKDFIRVFNYDGHVLRNISLDDPTTGLALAVTGICFVAREEETKLVDDDDDDDENQSKKKKSRCRTTFQHSYHDLVVVDELNHVVHRFDAQRGGSSLGNLLLPTDELGAATAISTTPEGHLAVVESGANTAHCFKVFRHRVCECHQIVDKSKEEET